MTTQVINSERIQATEFTMEANILTLNQAPSLADENRLFTDASVVLEF